jgi:signal transduction histidine kinase
MDSATIKPQTLSQILARRVLLFAFLAIAVQVVVVFFDYYFDDAQLSDLMIESEAKSLLKGVRVDNGAFAYRLPETLSRYLGDDNDYFVRVRTPEGRIVYSNCNTFCLVHFLPQEVRPPDLWSRILHPGRPIAVAGGRSFTVSGQKIFIEVAVLDDHAKVMWTVLAREFADHLAVPMSLMLVFVLGGMLLSIRIALKPVETAARAAERINPLDPDHRIDVEGMPREVADLGAAINRTLQRIHGLMQAQRLYTTAVAHEIRTPLAMMRLELGHIDHPRGRKIEGDIDRLARFVGQITALGRLESSGRTNFRPVELNLVARRVVTDVAPWIYDRRHAIAFVDAGAEAIDGQAPLLDDALRNLIENAVKHTPDDTMIQVVAGPGQAISVSDDAGLYRPPGPDGAAASADRPASGSRSSGGS